MKRLSQAKRNQLVLILLGTAALVSMVYFFLIAPQKEQNQKLHADTTAQKYKLDVINTAIKQASTSRMKAEAISDELANAESDVGTGDLFIWTVDTFRRFKTSYRLDIPSIGQPTLTDVDLIPNFPYKQIKFTISGTGFYHEIGKFVADLENKFPHVRISDMLLEPGTGVNVSPEKLSFQMELMALVKSNP